jgi:hypothetical protein
MKHRKSSNILFYLFMGEMDGNEITQLPEYFTSKKALLEEVRLIEQFLIRRKMGPDPRADQRQVESNGRI